MCTVDPPWITWAYELGAYPGIVFVIATMIYTVHDAINSVAPRWLRWARQISFTVMAVLLVNGLTSDASRLSMVLLFWSGIIAIVINLIALWRRSTGADAPCKADTCLTHLEPT
jgi:hypothetical protein